MFATKLGHYPLVLGIPWLRHHDVAIQFASNRMTFNSEFCLAHCNERPTTIWGVQEEPAAPQIASLPPAAPPKFSMVGAASFVRSAKREKLQILSTSLYELNRSLDRKTIEEGKLEELIPEEYHNFLPLFSEIVARELPPHRPYDHSIPLKNGFNPPFGPIYSLSRVELVGVLGNEIADQWASEAAVREMRTHRGGSSSRSVTAPARTESRAFLRSRLRMRAVGEWRDEIRRRSQRGRPYRIPREDETPRVPKVLQRTSKGLASRFF